MSTARGRFCAFTMLGALVAAGCTVDEATSPADGLDPAFAVASQPAPLVDAGFIAAQIGELNASLAAQGAGYAVERAELSFATNADPASPNIVVANNRTLRLDTRWVPGDARRGSAGNDITFANFQPLMFAPGAGSVEPSVDAAFGTWNAVKCSKLDLAKRALAPGVFPSAIFGLVGFANDPFAADISTVGFLPGFLFDAFLGPGASSSVLGVTWTFVFTDGAGNATDINHDGRDDTAIKEIWYNAGFTWSTTGSGGVDVETVALHEEGHALELGHFGKVTFNLKKGTFHASPRAVMNAVVLDVLRSPKGTDNGGYCGNWASWPR
jgi:hypothetical protein